MATPPPTTGWPLAIPWDDGSGPGPTAAAAAAATGPTAAPVPGKRRVWPPAEWPTFAQLSYTKELITVVLLVLALPWLFGKLATRPGDVLSAAGRKQVGGPT